MLACFNGMVNITDIKIICFKYSHNIAWVKFPVNWIVRILYILKKNSVLTLSKLSLEIDETQGL